MRKETLMGLGLGLALTSLAAQEIGDAGATASNVDKDVVNKAGTGSDVSVKRPNIILIIADDLSAGDLGCYGNSGVKSPNIDKLASKGMRFDNAFLTAASCSPSRASMMTGRWPHSNGQTDLATGELPSLKLPWPEFYSGVQFFPEVLKNAGYYTAHCGKWHIGYHWSNPDGESAGPARKGFDFRQMTNPNTAHASAWVRVLEKRPKDKPFFMWLASHDPHDPWVAPERHKAEDVKVPPYLPDTPLIRKDLAKYYDEIARLDDDVGAVVAELEKQAVLDNTLIIFVSDNGRGVWRSKAHMYGSGMQTPFIAHWPKVIKPGQVCNNLVSVIDLAPTFVDLAEFPKQNFTWQGRSVKDLFSKPDKALNRYVFSERNWHGYASHQRSVRDGQYLYIRNFRPELSNLALNNYVPYMYELWKKGELSDAQSSQFIAPSPKEELYLRSNDPHELKNLVGNKEHSVKLDELRKAMDSWLEITGDIAPENYVPDWYTRETAEKPGTPIPKELRTWGKKHNSDSGNFGSEDKVRKLTGF